jgi:BioD-like phosphotransacetylase family protein
MKPLSLQYWKTGGQDPDEDAVIAKEMLRLPQDPLELSPVVVTPESLRELMRDEVKIDLMDRLKGAAKAAGDGQDVLLLEGGASMREGYAVGLPTPAVAKALDCQVIFIVRFHDIVQILDDALAAKARLGDTLGGVLINQVPNESWGYVAESAIPYLEGQGVTVIGMLPEVRALSALSVEEIIEALDADVLVRGTRAGALVESLNVGAMYADAALSRFRQKVNQAVITGGDRTDIQLAALETSTTCLILTGGMQPSPLVLKQARDFGVTVLMVRRNTVDTVERMLNIRGKTRMAQTTKLRQFQTVLQANLDFGRLYHELGIHKGG